MLDSVQPVIEGSRDVQTDLGRLADVASWLAYEELPKPAQMLPVRLDGSREEIADFVLVAASLNVAYTDFETRQRWDLVVDGRAYADADGLEVLTRDFPRFHDVAEWQGEEVRFWKLAQLAVWFLDVTLPGGLGFRDLDRLTAFADYIVPAALHVMGVLRYSEDLDSAIVRGEPIEAGSAWEVELRAHTIYATALLCDRVNELRPPELRVIVPQIDARLWVPFHKSHLPHHLTRTIYY